MDWVGFVLVGLSVVGFTLVGLGLVWFGLARCSSWLLLVWFSISTVGADAATKQQRSRNLSGDHVSAPRQPQSVAAKLRQQPKN